MSRKSLIEEFCTVSLPGWEEHLRQGIRSKRSSLQLSVRRLMPKDEMRDERVDGFI